MFCGTLRIAYVAAFAFLSVHFCLCRPVPASTWFPYFAISAYTCFAFRELPLNYCSYYSSSQSFLLPPLLSLPLLLLLLLFLLLLLPLTLSLPLPLSLPRLLLRCSSDFLCTINSRLLGTDSSTRSSGFCSERHSANIRRKAISTRTWRSVAA